MEVLLFKRDREGFQGEGNGKVEDDEYCMDIIQQVRAVEGLLSSISAHALDSHLHTCGKRAFQSQDEREQEKIIKELLIAFKASKK